MNHQTNYKNFSLLISVVNHGLGRKLLDHGYHLGASYGVILLGKGTARGFFIELLGLDEVKKEIVVMIVKSEFEDQILQGISEKFHMEKPNHGIVFSLSLNLVVAKNKYIKGQERIAKGDKNMRYETIFTIVDKERGDEVIDTARKSGAQGATIIHGRGSETDDKHIPFPMHIEPEKDIVMILIEKEKSQEVIEAIRKSIHLDEAGKGILFALDVNKTIGISGYRP